ncbi:YceI family protein [Fuerstiella marisgermanici]|uniref:Lipid/polyisoprenoid-binding YceI-like domain-containing protein n=1 Tax=Fuerstiella marisgermanici TaxID=1891926 RepID=A0A1P8WLW9_9PLAN|nr:YceI family protein [Fuerstiella marisgermanici]APZ95055.1 hypothetical protein Fuma_04707 [Fuerstiella marisgermanici]
MKLYVLLTIFPAMLLIGCTGSEAPETDPVDVENDLDDADHGMASADEDATAADGDSIALTPDNTTIAFIGSHVTDEKPDPKARTGQFEKFDGTAIVEGGELKSLEVAIDTTSITTEQDKLTNHLKSPDFFDVNQHPEASFAATKIEAGEAGQVVVTGDLTLLGTTKTISFPATVSTEDGLKLDAEFTIQRTAFGMEYGPDKVEDDVQMMVTIGS